MELTTDQLVLILEYLDELQEKCPGYQSLAKMRAFLREQLIKSLCPAIITEDGYAELNI